MTPIRFEKVTKRYGTAVAVDDVSLTIPSGELFFLLGPSGCGKTTLLRILAGFAVPDAGAIFFGDQDITNLPPRARGAALVFQTYALWPHLSVSDNVAYGLRVRGLARSEIADRVTKALQLVRMDGYGGRRPNQLSGGQQQRVALARALVIEPRMLLLDEPLSNLDARLRDEMREEIRRLHGETGLTMVYVTHDQKEALALANRLAVMDRGRIVQVGSPGEVYQRPATRFVAGFLGDANFIPGTLRRGQVETPLGTLTTAADGLPDGTPVTCAIRPHSLRTGDGVNRIAATVEQVMFLGETVQVRLTTAAGIPLLMTSLPHAVPRTGEAVSLTVEPEQVAVLAGA